MNIKEHFYVDICVSMSRSPFFHTLNSKYWLPCQPWVLISTSFTDQLSSFPLICFYVPVPSFGTYPKETLLGEYREHSCTKLLSRSMALHLCLLMPIQVVILYVFVRYFYLSPNMKVYLIISILSLWNQMSPFNIYFSK